MQETSSGHSVFMKRTQEENQDQRKGSQGNQGEGLIQCGRKERSNGKQGGNRANKGAKD